jgi:hypothetical protein
MKVAALFPIGTSDGGCPVAIAEILKSEPRVEVYLLYGKRAAPDALDPKDVVERIQVSIRDPRVMWGDSQSIEPFDLSEAYTQVRTFVAGIAEKNYARVYVGITGGTNPVVTSLFQTAMSYLTCQVLPIYVQARGTLSVQHFLASDIRDRVIAEDALIAARAGQVRLAARLAERLPSDGQWKFLSSSLSALAHWDDFDYSQAKQTLKHQVRKAGEYLGHSLLGRIADTVVRIGAAADEMSAFAKQISDEQNFGALAMSAGWGDRVALAGLKLVVDVLANADRRIVEGRFTDTVQRAYRASECATQMRLMAIGIHPSRPDACRTTYERYTTRIVADAPELAFWTGLQFLKSAGQIDLAPIEGDVKNLANARNYTYLEHGYQRVQEDQARRCFRWSMSICEHLLGREVGEIWQRFEMRF